MKYSALNRADLVQREGKYPNQKIPLPLGLECSGIVEEAGCEGLVIAFAQNLMLFEYFKFILSQLTPEVFNYFSHHINKHPWKKAIE